MVAFVSIGAYVGSNYYTWEDNLYRILNERRVKLGKRPEERKEQMF
jgi:hypothetical protein